MMACLKNGVPGASAAAPLTYLWLTVFLYQQPRGVKTSEADRIKVNTHVTSFLRFLFSPVLFYS